MSSTTDAPLACATATLMVLAIAGCGTESDAPPPAAATPAAEPSEVMVNVTASSDPPGAAVTGGGQMLGRTPLMTQVPVSPTAGASSYAFTFQLPGYNPVTVEATPTNNTISVDATLTPVRGAGTTPAPAIIATPEPAARRALSVIVRDYQPTDASSRFVWAATGAESIRVQLLCEERAIEAARRAALRFRRAARCTELECEMEHSGNSDPRLYAERVGDGAQLIGYWNALAGDASRDRIEGWRQRLARSEVIESEL